MGRIIKTLLISIAIFHFSFFIFHLPRAFADTSCQPIYGGGQTCTSSKNIKINQTVLHPENNKLVDSLSVNDPKYEPGFITTFQITLTNTGNQTISKIKVTDIFPNYVNFSAGPGSFDNKTKTLTFEVENLKPNELRIYTIMGRVALESQIPSDKGVICVINQTIAKNMDNTSEIAQDNSQFCLEKKTAVTVKSGFPVFPTSPISKTPSTGPEALVLFSLIPTGIAGWILRKKSGRLRL